ncbi:hypothetical protein Hanom_Chr02g00132251 [Helianthus anomalus]
MQEAARAALDKGKNIAKEEVLESSSQQEQKQPETEVQVEKIEAYDAEIEVNVEENPLVPGMLFTLIGEPKPLIYSKEDNLKIIEIERRRLEEKKVKAAEIVDEKEDDEDEEDDDFEGIDDYHYDGDDDDDDNNDDDDQGGAVGTLIVRPPGVVNIEDYLNDEQNEEHGEAQRQWESTYRCKQAATHQVLSKTPKVIYLTHDVEEGEFVEN